MRLAQAQETIATDRLTLKSVTDSLSASEVLASIAKQQLSAVESERDKNIALLAKLITDKGVAEESLLNVQKELLASNERCANLRAMNEELLAMLESNA